MYKKSTSLIFTGFMAGISLLFLLSFTACQSAHQPLHYGGQIYPEELLLEGMDVWSSHNLAVDHVIFKNPDDLVEAFRSGVVDIALFSDIQAARIFAEMSDKAVIIGVSERGDRMSTVVRADADIASWADLQGKKVALRSGSGVELALKRYFALHPELKWDAVEWIDLSTDEMPAALASGAVDAITALEPVPAMAQALGGMRVLASYGAVSPSPLVFVTTRDFAENHKNEIAAFLRGQQEKLDLIRSDPAQAARIASKEAQTYDLEIPASAFHIVFKRIDSSLGIDETAKSALSVAGQDLLEAG